MSFWNLARREVEGLSPVHALRSSLACLVLLSACAPGPSKGKTVNGAVTTCTFSADQQSTFIGTWPKIRIPVAVTQDFSTGERAVIAQALDKWNGHFNAVGGIQAFDYGGSAANFRVMTRANSPTQDQLCVDSNRIIDVAGTTYTGVVMIYKKGNDWAYGSQVLALTTTCAPTTVGPGGLRPFRNAMIELNYKDFYGAGQPYPDLVATVAHEAGHFAGLNHSCEGGSTTPGVPNCQTTIPVDYLRALMYPVVSLSNPTKDLNSNDQGRANCLFPGLWSH